MSEPVSNAEIEDVLSSIRRLVSEDPGKEEPQSAPAADANVERLVLTPAFRVSDEDARSDSEDEADVRAFEADDTADSTVEEVLADASDTEHSPDATPVSEIALEPENAQQTDAFADAGDELVYTENNETTQEPEEYATETDTELSDLADMSDAPAEVETVGEVAQSEVEAPAEGSIETSHTVEFDDVEDVPRSEPEHDNPLSAFETSEDWSFEETAQSAVVENVPDAPQVEEVVSEDPVDLAEQSPEIFGAEDMSLEDRIAELEAALEQSPQEWEPDGSEDGDSDETRPLTYHLGDTKHALAATLGDAAEPSAPEDAASVETTPEPELDVATPKPEMTAELADMAVEDAVEPVQQVEAVEAEPDTALDAALEELMPGDVDTNDATDASETHDRDENETVQAWEDVQSGDEAEETSDATVEGLIGSTVQAAAAMATAQVAGDRLDEDPEDGSPANDFLETDDAGMLDEDALRDLVADLVREELQGVLGERITRNVRRLVRREIKRAMAMRDLE